MSNSLVLPAGTAPTVPAFLFIYSYNNTYRDYNYRASEQVGWKKLSLLKYNNTIFI
jgi:hypothetical protein